MIILVLLVTTGLCLYQYLSSRTAWKNKDKAYTATLKEIKTKDTLRNSFQYLEYLTNGFQLYGSLAFEDPLGNSCFMRDLYNGQEKIILYLEQTHCSACYGDILDLLRTKYPAICSNDLIVVCSFMNFRSIIVYFKEIHLETSLVNLKDSDLNIPACSAGSPFLAVMDKDYRLCNCCIPLKEDLDKVETFVKAFINRTSI